MKEGWEYKKLGEVVEVVNGLWTGKKPPFVTVAVVRNTNFTKECTLDMTNVAYIDVEEKQFATRELRYGDIIIEKSGGSDKQPVGRPVFFNIKEGGYSFSNFTATLRITDKNQITPEFLHKALIGLYRQGVTRRLQSKTTGIHNLDFKSYLKIQIPLPPLSTQHSIVSELDEINNLLTLKRKELETYDKLAQSLFYEMFGDPVENEKGWEVKKYGDEFEIGSGGTPSKAKPEYWEAGNIPWIGSNMCQNSIINETDGKFITDEGLSHSSAKLLDKGTVLVALVGATIGKAALLRTRTSTNQNIAFIKVSDNKGYDSYFIFYHMMSMYDEFMNIGNGDFKMANLSFVRSLPIIKPPLPLQQLFAQRIEAIEQQKAQVKAAIEKLETLLAARMQYWFE